jgi:GTPase KRas protein
MLTVDGRQSVIKLLNSSLQFARSDSERKLFREHYIAQSDGVALMYSIDDRHSFEVLPNYQQWIILTRGADYLPMILVGNKCDLEEERAVTRHGETTHIYILHVPTPDMYLRLTRGLHLEAEALAQHIGCRYMEISAKTNINVDEMFHSLLREMRRHKWLFPMKPARKRDLAYPPGQGICGFM